MGYRIGIDTGGTFTDLVFYDASGELHCFKVPTTPAQPGASILTGIDEIRGKPRSRHGRLAAPDPHPPQHGGDECH